MKEYKTEKLIADYLDQDKIDQYLDMVITANAKFNLFSRNLDKPALLTMVAESMIPLDLGWIGGKSNPVLDIGSGWGIPSFPLLVSGKVKDVTFLERASKKSDLLSLMLSKMELKARIVNVDLAEFAPKSEYKTITMRQVSIDSKIVGELRRIAGDDCRLIYFGPGLPDGLFDKTDMEEYSIDDSDPRRIFRAPIAQKK